jgi:hypothetical protein
MTISCGSVDVVNLIINSTPTGARVWIGPHSGTLVDQGALNTTNRSFIVTPAGDYDIKLVLGGYPDYNTTVAISLSSSTTINATLATPADIRASSLVISQSNPCIQGSCVVTVTAKWTNYGQITGSFTPSITVVGTHTIDETYGSQNLAGGVESGPIVFTVRGLTAGTHSICPILNT